MERKGVSVDSGYPHVYLLNNSFSFKKMGEKKKKYQFSNLLSVI